MRYLILYVASLVLGGSGTWLISGWGTTIGLLDRSNDRSSHDGVVPKGGGIGILAAFLLASWVLGLPLLFWISIGLTALVSLYGDRKEVQPKVRLCIQFMAGVVLLAAIFHWEGRGWPVYVLIPVFSVFVVGTANYYNFMDGINGIAGITGIVGFGLLAWFGALSGSPTRLQILSICMGLACFGFLPFNMPRARVFMGDVGSVLLGFVFAGLVVGLSHSLNDFVVLCGFLFPFYADELTTVYARLRDEFPSGRMNSYGIRDDACGGMAPSALDGELPEDRGQGRDSSQGSGKDSGRGTVVRGQRSVAGKRKWSVVRGLESENGEEGKDRRRTTDDGRRRTEGR